VDGLCGCVMCFDYVRVVCVMCLLMSCDVHGLRAYVVCVIYVCFVCMMCVICICVVCGGCTLGCVCIICEGW